MLCCPGLEPQISQRICQIHQSFGFSPFLIGESLSRILFVQQGGQPFTDPGRQLEPRQIARQFKIKMDRL